MKKNLVCYKRLPNWNALSIPKEFREKHNTRTGIWAKLTILKGKLKFVSLTEHDDIIEEFIFTPETDIPFIKPEVWYRVAPMSKNLECYFELYCEPKDYFSNRYDLNPAHSEIVEAVQTISKCKALDLGSGQGRNALFLSSLGFNVTALDTNFENLQYLANISQEENLNIIVANYDINTANIRDKYDFIYSTVVFMFLNPTRIQSIIYNMQKQTNIGGYNLIVSAMSTDDAPSPMPFPFTFRENELKDFYKDWELIKYNEDFGHLHKTDANGNRYKLRFATLLAKKIK
ncbi:tellurite resistance methyltransferase TehB [Gemella sp. ND 6198]|uniref:SAM-dependent methyltransferase TehB n=1 Tax=Gemella sp. ND 6198 TaxID=2040624 RepID=UPI000E0CB38C|nr:SAM-dependent methyltransferase TehB [Gemella sp. ND 6198]AXI26024.1 tellurite resistance methyltransferase TehB [Gemella sp. ND 6198]